MQCVANCCVAAVYSQNVYYYFGKELSLGMVNSLYGTMQIYMSILQATV